jgi:hypothetical protein
MYEISEYIEPFIFLRFRCQRLAFIAGKTDPNPNA